MEEAVLFREMEEGAGAGAGVGVTRIHKPEFLKNVLVAGVTAVRKPEARKNVTIVGHSMNKILKAHKATVVEAEKAPVVEAEKAAVATATATATEKKKKKKLVMKRMTQEQVDRALSSPIGTEPFPTLPMPAFPAEMDLRTRKAMERHLSTMKLMAAAADALYKARETRRRDKERILHEIATMGYAEYQAEVEVSDDEN